MRAYRLKTRFDIQKEKAHLSFNLTPTLNLQHIRPPSSIDPKGGIINAKRESTSGVVGCRYVGIFRSVYRVRRRG
jgi:hypothetical protein